MRIFNIFRRKEFKPQPKQLRIDGTKTTLTPTPDDAELAAQALLESRLSPTPSKKKENRADKDKPLRGTPEYYHQLSKNIKASRAAEKRLTMRYLVYCEEQLALPKELYVGQIGEMEQELYKRQDIAEREGGELLRRWQRCLAECIVRQMSSSPAETTENTETNK